MFNLSDVLKFVIHRLNQSPFAKHDLVGNRHQRVPHVVLDFSDELDSVHEQKLEQLLTDISLVATELALYIFDKLL